MTEKVIIRSFAATDAEACKEIFFSNCPPYFDMTELVLLERWLEYSGNKEAAATAYRNAELDAFYVIENDNRVVGCGGFYIIKGTDTARLAWGMVHRNEHKKGFGSALLEYRLKAIEEMRPGIKIAIDTSQYTAPFFEKMGFKTLAFEKDAFGAGLDKYEMEKIK